MPGQMPRHADFSVSYQQQSRAARRPGLLRSLFCPAVFRFDVADLLHTLRVPASLELSIEESVQNHLREFIAHYARSHGNDLGCVVLRRHHG